MEHTAVQLYPGAVHMVLYQLCNSNRKLWDLYITYIFGVRLAPGTLLVHHYVGTNKQYDASYS